MCSGYLRPLVTILLLCSAGVRAHWTDIQRQFPEINLQRLESANLSLELLREPSAALNPKGTIVVLPAPEQHALSPKLLNTLRLNLPASGWHLLVLPAPEITETLPPEQKLLSQKAQLANRWQLLTQTGNLQPPVIAVAQGETAAWLNLLIADSLTQSPAALITLGAYLSDYQQNNQLLKQLSLTPLPLLDLVTALDHPYATGALTQRQQLAKQQQNPLYRQRHLSDAYQDQATQQWVLKEILGWLHATGF